MDKNQNYSKKKKMGIWVFEKKCRKEKNYYITTNVKSIN